MAGVTRTSAYDQYASEYAAYVSMREQHGPEGDLFGMVPHVLALLGDVAGQDVLDAGCGEGYLARILADRGARVTGVDLSPRLVELAGSKASASPIEYRAADLSEPRPELAGLHAHRDVPLGSPESGCWLWSCYGLLGELHLAFDRCEHAPRSDQCRRLRLW